MESSVQHRSDTIRARHKARSQNRNRNAATAEHTLEDSHASFVVEERPYIVVDGSPQFLEPPTVNRPIAANVTIKNIGKTPAFRFIGVAEIVKFRPTSEKPVNKELELIKFLKSSFREAEQAGANARRVATKFGGKRDLAPGAPTFTTAIATAQDQLTATDKILLERGDVRLYNLGLLTYYDSFGNRYETEYCHYFSGTNPQLWHICESNNEIR
jgi:hypothetical protein